MSFEVISGMNVQAGVYGRQSLARANKSEVSTATQIDEGRAEALKRGATHVEVYEDLGISAFKQGVIRPDFERLLADCRAGRINMIVVYYISRFSRMEPLDAIPIVTELLNLGVTIVSVTEGEFRKGNLMDLIHMIMRLDAAHNESKNKSVAVSRAKQAARALGGYVGGSAPYGFTLTPATRLTAEGKPVVVQTLTKEPLSAANLRRAWQTIKAHMDEPYEPGKPHPGSLSGICAEWNAAGIPTRGRTAGKRRPDSRWQVQQLRRALRDPRLAGFDADPVYDGDGAARRLREYRIRRDDTTLEPIVFDAEPIIPPVEWYALQAWLDGRGQGRGLSRGAALLSGLHGDNGKAILTCECQRPFSALNTSGKANNPVYRCTRPKGSYAGQHSGTNTITQSYLDDYAVRRIFALIQSIDGTEEDDGTADILAEAAKRFGRATEAPETAGERAAVLAERADAVAALEAIADGLINARTAIVRERLSAQEAVAAERLARIDVRLCDLDSRSTPVLPVHEWLPEDSGADPIGPGSWWHSANREARRDLVRLFCDRITVSKPVGRMGDRWTPYDTQARVSITWASRAG